MPLYCNFKYEADVILKIDDVFQFNYWHCVIALVGDSFYLLGTFKILTLCYSSG